MPFKLISFILIFLFISTQAQPASDITFTEIMFRPAASNAEFIELFNFSGTDSADLSGYSIVYQTSSPDEIIPVTGNVKLPPKSFAVIFEADYDFENGVYTELIPGNALLFILDDNAFGSSGMANTSDRTLYLLNSSGDTVDTYTYSADNGEGISDEKIFITDDNSETNWSNSLSVHGSPGTENTVSPKNYDLGIINIESESEYIFAGDDVKLIVTIQNFGLLDASSFNVNFYDDLNNDSIATSNELIDNIFISELAAGDELPVEFVIPEVSLRYYSLIIEIEFDTDQFPENNFMFFSFDALPRPLDYNSIIINEIMYKPDDEPEWVELFNASGNSVNIKDWMFSDAVSKVKIIEGNFELEPYSYLVLSDDESLITYYDFTSPEIVLSLPSLNNGGDNLKVIDNYERVIDSVNYKNTWGGGTDGRSLERLLANINSNDSTNWSTSISPENGTPGKENSVTPKDYDVAVTRFKMLNEFAVTGQQLFFDVVVHNAGLQTAGNFSVDIVNNHNGMTYYVTTLQAGNLTAGDSTILSFSTASFVEGKNNFHAIINFSLDQNSINDTARVSFDGLNIPESKFDIVINEIMYAPSSPEPEWIELYNRSDKNINMFNYKIADNRDTALVIDHTIILSPEEYFVIADDSSFADLYPDLSNFIISEFPSLNNSGDDIKLLNYINTIIDSVSFMQTWGGRNGKSLERISTEASSNDSTNWGSAALDIGGTPGRVNSISQKSFDVIVEDIVFAPPSPVIGDDVSISAVVTNTGKETAAFSLQLFLDDNIDSIATDLVEQSNLVTLESGESIEYTFGYSINQISASTGFLCAAEFDGDQDLSNNHFYKVIFPGYPDHSLLINEIMFTPQNGEPEWIELYNNSNYTIDLNGWAINDVFTSPVTRIIAEQKTEVMPNKLVVIAKDSSLYEFHTAIPSQVIISNFPNLNNDVDGIVIKDARGNVIDSVLYSKDWGNTGYSIERISYADDSNDSLNWAPSTDIEQSTPGRENSITPKNYDLKLERITTIPDFPIESDDVYVHVLIRNVGINNSSQFDIEFYANRNNNFELFDKVHVDDLKSGDSLKVISNNFISLNDEITIRVSINYSLDEVPNNNSLELELLPGYPRGSIIITEFIFDPADGSGEWVEFFNNSGSSINLREWSVSDLLSSPKLGTITYDDVIVEPEEFFVVSNDSINFELPENVKLFITNFGTLGNTEDGLVIYDFREGVIDSLHYNNSWNSIDGRSLERIEFDSPASAAGNWVPSIDPGGGTPGLINSIVELPQYSKGEVVVNEIMFAPGTGNSEFIEIFNPNNESINIGGWKLHDESGYVYFISNVSFELLPNSFYVLAADSNIYNYYSRLVNSENISITNTNDLSLSNDEETITITDLWGNIIDSVNYSDKWHNRNVAFTRNKSLERINPFIDSNDPGNWSTSVDNSGATPGMQNSIYTSRGTSRSKLEFTPNPFSPDNDGYEDFTIINYNLKGSTAQIRIKVFDDHGRLVRTLANNKPSGSTGSIIFDGLDENGKALRIGMYIVFLEALNSNSGVVETMKKVVVIARKL